jgi:hypothetical protein
MWGQMHVRHLQSPDPMNIQVKHVIGQNLMPFQVLASALMTMAERWQFHGEFGR